MKKESATEISYDEIHRQFREPIRRYFSRLCGEADADDLTQEVFLRVYKSLPSFRGESSVKTWIYRIATNMSLDRMRSAAYKVERRTTVLSDDLVRSSAYSDIWQRKTGNDPEDVAVKTEMIDCIADYISALNENFKTVIILSEFDNMKDTEIASILGISVSNVKIRLVRARNQLKKLLSKNCAISFDLNNDIRCDQK
jgi:RNA polymerase sigma-70 factor (ECF subfamily)